MYINNNLFIYIINSKTVIIFEKILKRRKTIQYYFGITIQKWLL